MSKKLDTKKIEKLIFHLNSLKPSYFRADWCKEYLTPVKYRNYDMSGYYLDDDGGMYSLKNSKKEIKKLSTHCYPNSKNAGNHYPHVGVSIDGKRKTARIHELVAWTFVEFKKPNGLSSSAWRNMSNQDRYFLQSLMQINHIDEDKKNYHPSNLEWVTGKENSEKYQARKQEAILVG